MTTDHAGRPPSWARWPTMEGGFLFDRQALLEALLVVEGAAPNAPDLADRAAFRAAALPEDRAGLRRAYDVIVPRVLDSGTDRCPHDRPIGLDLALPHGDADGAGLGFRLLAGPAMGSGRSPWTRAALAALSRAVKRGDRVADVGTGTGILALRAAALGAAIVDGVDNDPVAAAVGRWNARQNGAGESVRIVDGSVEALGQDYDLGIISISAIWDVAPVVRALVDRVRPGGRLIASPAQGLAECTMLEDALREHGIAPERCDEADGWYVWTGRRLSAEL